MDQKRCELHQRVIMSVVIPRLDTDSVFRLKQEVLRNVVHNYRLVQVTPQQRQVFDIELSTRQSVLAVESMSDGLLSDLTIADHG